MCKQGESGQAGAANPGLPATPETMVVTTVRTIESLARRCAYLEDAIQHYAPHAWNDIQRIIGPKP